MFRKLFLFLLFAGYATGTFAQKAIDVFILNKKFDEALLAVEKQEHKNPQPGLFLKKGMIYESLQNYQSAISAFQSGLKLDSINVDLNSEMAVCLSILGNNADAVPFYLKALEIDSTNNVLKGKLGKTYLNLNNYNQARAVFDEIYSIDSTNVFWNKQYAYCLFKTGDKKRAAKLYEKVIAQNPRDLSSYLNLVHLYNRKQEPEKITKVLMSGLKEFPENQELFLEFANFYFGNKQYEMAMLMFDKYFQLLGEHEYKIQLNYAISCYFAHHEKKSLDALEVCSIMAPNDPFMLFYKSLNYKRLANYPDAEKFMQYAIDSSYPDFLPEMYHHLGQIFGAQRKFQESVDALNKSYELNPEKHEILFEIATTYEEFNSNKTLALNYYQLYLREAGEAGKNTSYALDRITRIKEDLFFEE